MVNGSRGTGSRRQNSPIHPGSFSCACSPVASLRPEVWEPRWRTVMRDLRGSEAQDGTYFEAGSSSRMRPSVMATASETPPIMAFAMDAV